MLNLSVFWKNRPLALTGAALLACLLCVQGCTQRAVEADTSPEKSGGGKGGKKGKGGRGGDGGPIPVVVAQVTERNVPIEVTAVGNVEAYSTVNVVGQIGGQLTQAYFREGDYVRKGQKLFSIDPSPIEAQVAQAEANKARDEAMLGQAQANVARDSANEKYAHDEAGRYAKLFDQGIISREQRDQLSSSADAISHTVAADRAAVESARAQVLADDASIKNLKVQLAYTTIYSPLDGRTGNLAVKVGNVVIPNTMILVTITQVQPIYATFSVPETRFAEVRQYMAQGKLSVQASPQDGSTQSESGTLTFVDNNVDMTTGTIKLKGTFSNPSMKLWPGEYVNVVLRMGMAENALVVPNEAVQAGQEGNYVYVVNEDRTVAMRPVTTGSRVEQSLVIEKGLEKGETVVTEGQLRIAEGSRVQISGPNGPGGGGRGKGGKGRPKT